MIRVWVHISKVCKIRDRSHLDTRASKTIYFSNRIHSRDLSGPNIVETCQVIVITCNLLYRMVQLILAGLPLILLIRFGIEQSTVRVTYITHPRNSCYTVRNKNNTDSALLGVACYKFRIYNSRTNTCHICAVNSQDAIHLFECTNNILA